MRVLLLLLLCSKFGCVSLFAQTDVNIHPAQVGLFGVGTGYILTSNPSGSGGQWSTSSSVINSAVTGSIGNIMSYAAGGWTANTFLNVSGSDLRVGSTAASHIRFIPSTPEISLFNAGNIDARFGADALGFYTNVGLSISGPCTTTGNLIVGGSINTSLPFRAPGIISAPVSTAPASAGAGSITCWAAMTSPAFINFVENGVGYHGTVGSVAGGGIEITTGGETPGVGTRRLFVSSAGNIGIATSTPARTLHVHGGLRVTQSNGSATGLWGSDANGDFAALSLGSGLSISSNTLNAAFIPTSTTFNGDINGPSNDLQIIANAVTTAEIATGAVRTDDILDGTIAGIDVANESLTGADILNGSILANDIGDGAVTAVKQAAGEAIAVAGNYSTWGTDRFVRIDAAAASRTVTVTDALTEGWIYLVRCTNNATNTVTFQTGTGVTAIGLDQNNTLALTSFVSGGASGTGVLAPFKVYHLVRFGGTVWIN